MNKTREEYWDLYIQITDLYTSLIKSTHPHTPMSTTKDKLVFAILDLFKQLYEDTRVGIT